MNVREAANEYLASLKLLQPETVVGYTHRLGVFADWCEQQYPPIELKHVRRVVVDTFVEYLRDTRVSHKATKPQPSTQTLAGYVRVIVAFLHWCLEDEKYCEVVKQATVSRIKLPKTEQTIIETFSRKQLDALFEVCSKECDEHLQARDRAILAVLVETGIRATELCELTITNTHLDPKDAFIRVHGKGNKWREVGLGNKSRIELKSYLRLYRKGAQGTETVFVSRFLKPLLHGGLQHIIYRLGEWAYIEGVRCSPHTFRHTFACHYLTAGGGDIYVLSLLMGHTSVRITERYLKAIKAKQARQASNHVKSILA